jgi:hypothetical protein
MSERVEGMVNGGRAFIGREVTARECGKEQTPGTRAQRR